MRILYDNMEFEVHAIQESAEGLNYFVEYPDFGFYFVHDRNIKIIDDSMPKDWTSEVYPDYLGFTIIGPPCMTKDIKSFEGSIEHVHAHIEALQEFARKEERRKLQEFFGGCFPENWRQNARKWSDVVEKYFCDAPSRGHLASVLDALNHFSADCINRDEREIEEELLLEYHCFYWPSEEDRFVKPWLDLLIHMFEMEIKRCTKCGG